MERASLWEETSHFVGLVNQHGSSLANESTVGSNSPAVVQTIECAFYDLFFIEWKREPLHKDVRR